MLPYKLPPMRSLLFLSLLCSVVLSSWAAEKPKPRTRAEVNAVLGANPRGAPPRKPLRICLVASKQDHGPGEHDYPAWQTKWAELLGKAAGVTVSTNWQWPNTFEGFDVAVFYFW